MIVKFNRSGKSFKGLAHYLTHDAKAATDERVGWTYTFNCTNDHVPSAIHEMYSTYLDAELLKEVAGVRRGGQPLQNPVKHFSLNWHPDDGPTKKHMIDATEEFLAHMGWQDHQAVLVAHTDKEHAHVHCMLNVVNPETGLKLDDGFEKRRAQEWAAEYEREQGRIYCTQRELPIEEREPSPTRPVHVAMKEGKRVFEAQEQARQEAGEKRGAREAGPRTASEEWDELKKAQREARQGFFEDGRDAFRDIQNAAYRQTREEFREYWAAFYAIQKDGLDMGRLTEIRDDLVARQHEALTRRRDQYCTELRETRDAEYAGLLASQKAERAQLTGRLAGDEPRQDIQKSADNQNIPAPVREGLQIDAFRSAASEVTQQAVLTVGGPAEEGDRGISVPFDDQDCTPRAVGPRVREGIDIGTGLTGGVVGGLADLSERLFDGFFGQPVAPAPKEAPRAQANTPPEPNRWNAFAEAAEIVKRRTETDDDERKADEWWDERRARTRD